MPDPSTQNRDNFPYLISVPTRLSDNDMLGHVNNVIYYRYIEAVVVRFQMEEAGVVGPGDGSKSRDVIISSTA